MENQEPAKNNDQDPIEQAKNYLVIGVVVVVAVAGIFAYVLYSRMNQG